MLFKKGKYYIGDPCYIFSHNTDSWDQFGELTNDYQEGLHTVFGEEVYIGNTAYGDGSFVDNFGKTYGVDAGMLSIIPVSLLKHDNEITTEDDTDYYNFYTFDSVFEVDSDNGTFFFGNIVINTGCDEDEDEDY